MKMLWTVVSFLAVVHLLALAMFVGWLRYSGRLNEQRVLAVKDMFSKTIEDAAEDAAAAEAAAAQEARDAADEARRVDPPISSAETVHYVSMIKQQEEQAKRRLEGEIRALQLQLEQRSRALDDRERRLDLRDERWRAANQADVERRTDEQFLKTVKLYESIPPKQAKQMLIELVDGGDLEQAVAYVDAMNPRAAAKIIKELKTDTEVELATELLEALRTFGLPPEAPEDADDAQSVVDAD
jgi:hypothetical protein